MRLLFAQITLRSNSDHSHITFDAFDVGIVENVSCNSPYVENILTLYIRSILSGSCNSQVFKDPPCLVDENKGNEVGGGGGRDYHYDGRRN